MQIRKFPNSTPLEGKNMAIYIHICVSHMHVNLQLSVKPMRVWRLVRYQKPQCNFFISWKHEMKILNKLDQLERLFTWVASQMVLKLRKWLLRFSTPYLRIIVLSTNFPAKKEFHYQKLHLQTHWERWYRMYWLTYLLCFSLQHCGLICNTNFHKISVWIKPHRHSMFKFLETKKTH